MKSRNALIPLAMAGMLFTHFAAATEGDASNGANVFTTQCAICHSVKEGKNKIGPSLAGIVGRPAGSLANFTYSEALKNSGVTWTADQLNAYLTKPSAMIPGIKMPYQGLGDDRARQDLIAYLSAQSSR